MSMLNILSNCSADENKRRRFTKALSAPSVNLLRIKDNTFVLLNSMAFEGDACEMCQDAEVRLKHISNLLKCAQVSHSIVCCTVILFNQKHFTVHTAHTMDGWVTTQ